MEFERRDEDNSRVLTLTGTVDENSTSSIIERIREWNKEDDKEEAKLKKYTRPVIEILIDSYGGQLYSGLGLASVIGQSKTPIHTICTSKAMSAGLIVLIAGHKRFCYPLSYMMYHQLSGMAVGTMQDMEDSVSLNKKLQKVVEKFVTDHTKINKYKLKEIKSLKKDFYIDSKKAVKLGIIDEVL